MSEFLSSLFAFIIILGVGFGLSYWAFRAEKDNSARVGIYLVFGFPGVLLTIAGLALSVYGIEAGPVVLASGIGLTLPLVPSFRVWLSSVTPIDPKSQIDLVGLCLILGLIGFLATSIVNASPSSDGSSGVSVSYLLIQVLAEIGLALAAVGWWFRRTIEQAIHRLGLVRPTGKMIAIALGCTVLAFVINGLASYMTEWLQPHVYHEVQKATQDISANVQNPIGAVILGLSAGGRRGVAVAGGDSAADRHRPDLGSVRLAAHAIRIFIGRRRAVRDRYHAGLGAQILRHDHRDHHPRLVRHHRCPGAGHELKSISFVDVNQVDQRFAALEVVDVAFEDGERAIPVARGAARRV